MMTVNYTMKIEMRWENKMGDGWLKELHDCAFKKIPPIGEHRIIVDGEAIRELLKLLEDASLLPYDYHSWHKRYRAAIGEE